MIPPNSFRNNRQVPGALQSLAHGLKHAQSSLETLNRDVTVNRSASLASGRIVQRRMAVVTNAGPSSEADPSGNEYWCKFQKVTWSGTIATFSDATAPGIAGIVKATNIGEVPSSHQLDTDETVYVEIVKILSSTSPPIASWSFNRSVSDASSSTIIQVKSAWTGNGLYKVVEGLPGAIRNITTTSNFLIADLVAEVTGDGSDAIGINMREFDSDTSGHKLDTSGGYNVFFPALKLGFISNEGYTVYAFWGAQIRSGCT